MALSTHIIIDSSDHQGVSLFWKRHESVFLKQLSPVTISQTNRETPIEPLMLKIVRDGWKKIIIIGVSQSIFKGINILMGVSSDIRSSLDIGLWPLNSLDIGSYLVQPSISLLPILQIFKTGHTFPVDIVKMRYITENSHLIYFWKDCLITNLQSDVAVTLFVDQQEYQEQYFDQLELHFHEKGLRSVDITPNELKHTDKISLSSHSGKMNWAESLKMHWKIPGLTGRKEDESSIKCGNSIEIVTQQPLLEIQVEHLEEKVREIRCEIIRKAFSLIVPVMPVRSPEKIPEALLSLKTKGMATNNRLKKLK